jgi:lipopolysaccharide biosynthesis glycosyltransferase
MLTGRRQIVLIIEDERESSWFKSAMYFNGISFDDVDHFREIHRIYVKQSNSGANAMLAVDTSYLAHETYFLMPGYMASTYSHVVVTRIMSRLMYLGFKTQGFIVCLVNLGPKPVADRPTFDYDVELYGDTIKELTDRLRLSFNYHSSDKRPIRFKLLTGMSSSVDSDFGHHIRRSVQHYCSINDITYVDAGASYTSITSVIPSLRTIHITNDSKLIVDLIDFPRSSVMNLKSKRSVPQCPFKIVTIDSYTGQRGRDNEIVVFRLQHYTLAADFIGCMRVSDTGLYLISTPFCSRYHKKGDYSEFAASVDASSGGQRHLLDSNWGNILLGDMNTYVHKLHGKYLFSMLFSYSSVDNVSRLGIQSQIKKHELQLLSFPSSRECAIFGYKRKYRSGGYTDDVMDKRKIECLTYSTGYITMPATMLIANCWNTDEGVSNGVDNNTYLYNPRSELCVWHFTTNLFGSRFDFQTPLTTLSHFAKCSSAFQKMLQVDKDSFYVGRGYMMMNGIEYKGMLIKGDVSFGTEIVGRVKIGSDIRYVVPSGHMINMLLSGTAISGYCRQIVIQASMKLSDLTATYERLRKAQYLSEHNTLLKPGELWHSWLDYLVSVYVYVDICRWLEVPVDVWGVRLCYKVINVVYRLAYRADSFRVKHVDIPPFSTSNVTTYVPAGFHAWCSGPLKSSGYRRGSGLADVIKGIINLSNGYIKGLYLLRSFKPTSVSFMAEAPGGMMLAARHLGLPVKSYMWSGSLPLMLDPKLPSQLRNSNVWYRSDWFISDSYDVMDVNNVKEIYSKIDSGVLIIDLGGDQPGQFNLDGVLSLTNEVPIVIKRWLNDKQVSESTLFDYVSKPVGSKVFNDEVYVGRFRAKRTESSSRFNEWLSQRREQSDTYGVEIYDQDVVRRWLSRYLPDAAYFALNVRFIGVESKTDFDVDFMRGDLISDHLIRYRLLEGRFKGVYETSLPFPTCLFYSSTVDRGCARFSDISMARNFAQSVIRPCSSTDRRVAYCWVLFGDNDYFKGALVSAISVLMLNPMAHIHYIVCDDVSEQAVNLLKRIGVVHVVKPIVMEFELYQDGDKRARYNPWIRRSLTKCRLFEVMGRLSYEYVCLFDSDVLVRRLPLMAVSSMSLHAHQLRSDVSDFEPDEAVLRAFSGSLSGMNSGVVMYMNSMDIWRTHKLLIRKMPLDLSILKAGPDDLYISLLLYVHFKRLDPIFGVQYVREEVDPSAAFLHYIGSDKPWSDRYWPDFAPWFKVQTVAERLLGVSG